MSTEGYEIQYHFNEDVAVTLPAHQWQLLMAASTEEMEAACTRREYGLAQAISEIAHAWRIAWADAGRPPASGVA